MPSLDIFVAAHPEFPTAALEKHFGFLQRKIEAGANGLIANIVTDADAFFRYRDRAHAAGIRQPIIPSVLPLNSLRRCEFLTEQLHIAVPTAIIERLRSADRQSAQQFGLDDLVTNLQRLVAGGAPGANFNIVVPSDAEVVVEAIHAFRSCQNLLVR